MGEINTNYAFCGIGGSGMMPLALILHARGATITGSDRAYDQGKTPEKFAALRNNGITLCAQDGSAITPKTGCLVVSGAIEETVPDVIAARTHNVPIKTRAEVLAGLFNTFNRSISVAGTSGKSTVTGMIATILTHCQMDPTVMNGGVIENFTAQPQSPFPNMRTGHSDIFVTETDESDGSIALYTPHIALINNIALDHMPLDQLQDIFLRFANRTKGKVILNMDNTYIQTLKNAITTPIITYACDHNADLKAEDITPTASGVQFSVQGYPVALKVPGRHNVSNALAALCAATTIGIPLESAAKALSAFTGIRRRMQIIGARNGITVIDDFAHNPDKIEASLRTLKETSGRLIIMFQMHGYGPIKLMGDDIINSFAAHLSPDDHLIMPEVYYAGGTVDRSKTAKDMIAYACTKNINAQWFEAREETEKAILAQAQPNDRIIIMGARDDSLTDFAKHILAAV